MSKKTLIAGLVLLVGGSAVAGWIIAQQKHWEELQGYCRDKSARQAEQIIEAYHRWLSLPENEWGEMPWLDEVSEPNKLRIQQQERLIADIDRLAQMGSEDGRLAEVLYGKGWSDEVERYKRREKARVVCLICSIGLALLGFVIILLWSTALIKGLVVRFIKSIRAARIYRQNCTDSVGGVDVSSTASNDCECDTEAIEVVEEDEVKVESTAEAAAGCVTDKIESGADMVIGGMRTHLQMHTSQMSLIEAIRRRMQQSQQQVVAVSDNRRDGPDEALERLAEELAAIRRYTSEQQEKVKKLQDGYDWSIIKNFCLRVIRCIDNLDMRIEELSCRGLDAEELERIRDELIFALESSGIERFVPQVNDDFRGQEKMIEVVSDRQECHDGQLSGKIAKVLRCGYRYFVDEDNFRVVRPAQVRLFA